MKEIWFHSRLSEAMNMQIILIDVRLADFALLS